MDKLPIIFVSGLPRSGSTLLMNLLGQNPQHHVTPSNGLLDLLVLIRDRWQGQSEFQAQGLDKVKPRVLSMMRGMIEGFYRDELRDGKIIFDKSRGWLAYLEMMEEVLQRPTAVLVTVRDIRAIVASNEKLLQRNPLTSVRPENYFLSQTIEGRATLYLSEAGPLGWAIARLRDALRRPHKSMIILVPYTHLCSRTQLVMDRIHQALSLPSFQYDPEHVAQLTFEDDSSYGMPLHDIRTKVDLGDPMPWKNVLPDALCEALNREYADIQHQANRP